MPAWELAADTVAQTIYEWISPNENVLLAIDSPLGWPVNMGKTLCYHSAGKGIDIDSNDLFRRETDKFVKRKLGKQPLDVGADRIARTAHTALRIINELRLLTGKTIQLAWDNQNLIDISAIEVYPAATLDCYKITSTGYKEKNKKYVRKEIVDLLRNYMIIPKDLVILEENADALDSVICLLAAKDFIDGNVYYPEDIGLAKLEGWIWVKKV